MFIGEFKHSLDSKGRVIIPSRLRSGLGDRFIITRGFEQCLFVYPSEEWSLMGQKLEPLLFTKSDARNFKRLFFSGAVEVDVDKQNRVLIPQHLREYAGIEKDVMFVGVQEKVEIWSEESWRRFFVQANDNYTDMAENLNFTF